MAIKLVSKKFIDGFMLVIEPIANLLIVWKVHPHAVTVVGLLMSVFAGFQFYLGNLVWGGVFFILAGACDVLDGKLARSTNQVSQYGAFFDSSVDRYSEVFVFMGLVAYYKDPWVDMLLMLALGGSIITSYVRARAESLGIECKVGIMQRPERITFLSVGAVFSFFWSGTMILAIVGVAFFSNYTAIQRIIHTYNNAK